MWVLIIWLFSALWGAPACLSWAKAQHWVNNPKLFLIILWFHWPYFASRNTLCFFFFFLSRFCNCCILSLKCSVSRILQGRNILPFNYHLKCHLLWSAFNSWTNLFAKLSYWFCISQQIFLKWYLSNRYCSMFPEYKEEIIMMSLLSRNSNCIHTIST